MQVPRSAGFRPVRFLEHETYTDPYVPFCERDESRRITVTHRLNASLFS